MPHVIIRSEEQKEVRLVKRNTRKKYAASSAIRYPRWKFFQTTGF